MTRHSLKLLGGFEVRTSANLPLELRSRKAQALLAYLALPPGRRHARDKLMALLWPEAGEPQVRHSFRQALSDLRKVLGGGHDAHVLVEGDTVMLNAVSIDVDAVEFERRLAGPRLESLEDAVALYHGDLLAGLAVNEAPFDLTLRRLLGQWPPQEPLP